MELEELGFDEELKKFMTEEKFSGFEPARVIAGHKERYIVRCAAGDYEAEITGNIRFTARSGEDFPAVGDWVAITPYEPGFAIIHGILPRSSLVKRQSAGQAGEIQVIAANIGFAFIFQAVDRDFNMNRIERYLTICLSSRVKPLIVLTKTDLISEQRLSEICQKIAARITGVPVIPVSNISGQGFDELEKVIQKGKTYCLLGSSGVGKSTLVNKLAGKELMNTGNLSESTHKGKHTTTHRELFVLPNGGILIDNPGMKEVGIADTANGLEQAFDHIIRLSEKCWFSDCTHTGEKGCAVLAAVENGEIERNSYENYLKLEREKAHFETSVAEKRKKDKIFGKMIKDYHKRNIK